MEQKAAGMAGVIQQAVALRQQGHYDESRLLLRGLLDQPAYAPSAHLQIAWCYDNQGREQEAIPHYQAALSGELSATERFDALFGLACTYRSLGDYATALGYFEQTLAEYPAALEVQPFYAICLYNLGRHQEATALLLTLLVSTTQHPEIQNYQNALLLYANNLDKKW